MLVEHKYLVACLLGLPPLCVALLLAHRLRNTAILCGFLLSLYGPPVAWLYNRVYWTPDYLFGGSWGIEDILFCFHAGAISWICALGPWGDRLQIHSNKTIGIWRFLTISALAAVGLLCFLGSGFSVILAFLLTQTISTAIILFLRPSYIRFVASGLPIFLAPRRSEWVVH